SGPEQPWIKTLSDPEYERLHSLRSARIVGAWLREHHASEAVVEHVEALIVAHEFGGCPEPDLVQAVDSLSFLETNIDLFLGFVRSGKHPAHEVRKKFNSMFGRIQIPRLKDMARPLVDRALQQLDAVEREVQDMRDCARPPAAESLPCARSLTCGRPPSIRRLPRSLIPRPNRTCW